MSDASSKRNRRKRRREARNGDFALETMRELRLMGDMLDYAVGGYSDADDVIDLKPLLFQAARAIETALRPVGVQAS